jgi:hypothetical protein
MKKITYIIAVFAFAVGLTSCGKDFLDRDNISQMEEGTFYDTPEQMGQAISGVYSQLQSGKGIWSAELIADIMSDECFAGGSAGDIAAQNMDEFDKNHMSGLYDDFWANTYKGIFRANKVIENIDRPVWESEDQKNQIYGEALFMRAFFNLRLGEFWGQAPLIIDTSKDPNQPKASGDEIFAQVASDLKKAIDVMPSNTYSTVASGHATKWAAEALMARAFLFYTGYYNKTSMPLAEGGEITRDQAFNYLTDLIKNSGHALASDFRNIWSYSHNPDYPWARDNNLEWIGDGPENTETIFAIKHSPYAVNNAKTTKKYSNQYQLFIGVRGNPANNQYGKGWGMATVNPQLWESFDNSDLRKQGTLLNATDKVNEVPFANSYKYGRNNALQETGYYNKKYMPTLELNSNGKRKGMYYLLFGGQDHFQLWNMADQILIRYADVLLMAAELDNAQGQQYLDEVRKRAGLPTVPATLDNIKVERSHELALEGLRYHDLMRWHDVETAFSKVVDVDVYDHGLPAKYNQKYRPETGGFLPIPKNQIALSAGVLTQNPGW